MLYLFYIVVALAIIAIANALFPQEERVSIIKTRRTPALSKIFVVLFKPLSAINYPLLKLFPIINNNLRKGISFVKWDITPAAFLSSKEVVAIVVGVGSYFFISNLAIAWIFLAAGISFFIPDFILYSKIKRKKNSIVQVLPETVDLLSLCISAGLDFMSAVRWIIAKAHSNPMIEELKDLTEEIKIGRSKPDSLRQMSRRLNIPEVSSFVRSIIQAERMGTPVEEIFNIISDDMRVRRTYRGEREAVKASLKMLIPLIVFILPVILIIVAGPVLLEFIRGGIGNIMK